MLGHIIIEGDFVYPGPAMNTVQRNMLKSINWICKEYTASPIVRMDVNSMHEYIVFLKYLLLSFFFFFQRELISLMTYNKVKKVRDNPKQPNHKEIQGHTQ